MEESLLAPGRNCWRKEHASRVAFLVDGAAYFAAVADAVEHARESVLVLGWDLDRRVRLRPDGDALADFLVDLLERRSSLRVYLLAWDFAMIYALERDWLPLFRTGWPEHPRLSFRFDACHPVGACHHQKVVVVDDAIAFVGGLDLAKRRWDTPEHHSPEPRRIDPLGEAYGPFHDVQMAVDGAAAAALGDLARERWARATGERLVAARGGSDPWPAGLQADLLDVEVAIARTEPQHLGRDPVLEVERLYLDAVAAAKRFLYVESQYLSSSAVTAALAARLRDQQGPEVVLVLPARMPGWLEQLTMDVLRARHLRQLREADVNRRLGVYYPRAAGSEEPVYVHSKVMLVDDVLVRVGSSNLDNRSMGIDTECDLAVEAHDATTRRGIAAFRDRLLAEHLGLDLAELQEEFAGGGSLLSAIEALRGRERTLVPLDLEASEWLEDVAPASLADPESAIAPDALVEEFLSEDAPEAARNPWVRAAAGVALLLALGAAWRFTALGDWTSLERLADLAAWMRQSPLTPLLVVLAFVVGALLMLPLTAMIVATALTFDPLRAVAYSLAGGVAASGATYAVGHFLGRDAVRRVAGARLNWLSRRMAKRGVLTTTAARILPLGPFTLVNIVAGASHIRFRDFLLGSFLGLLPGTLAINVFEDSLRAAIRDPSGGTLALLAVLLLSLVASVGWLRRRFRDEQHG